MYNILMKLNNERKILSNYSDKLICYTLEKTKKGYFLKNVNLGLDSILCKNMNDLVRVLLFYDNAYILNLSLLKSDINFLNKFYIYTDEIRSIVLGNTVLGIQSVHIKFRLVDSIDKYLGRLFLLKNKEVRIMENKIFYVLLRYDNVVELISQIPLIVIGDCLNFMSIPNLEYIYIDNLNVLNLRSLYKFFYNCPKLKTVILKNFNTKHIRDISGAFSDCINLENINLEDLDLSKVKKYDFMLKGTKIDINRLSKYNFNEFLLNPNRK